MDKYYFIRKHELIGLRRYLLDMAVEQDKKSKRLRGISNDIQEIIDSPPNNNAK